MATTKQSSSLGPIIKSDEIHVDTSQTPWMTIAKGELNKGVREVNSNEGFYNSLRGALATDAWQRNLANQVENFGKDSMLLASGGGPAGAAKYHLTTRKLPDPSSLVGKMEAADLHRDNPQIAKYFDRLKSDPAYDKKRGRSYDVQPTNYSGANGNITAWCAAFVNWCLVQAGVPNLGYATARSWLDFGTPVIHPVYGCITVIKPSTSTGSTTGHVAFYVEHHGTRVKLLGGNQENGTRVSETTYPGSWVLGYRWPTSINNYLLAGAGVVV